MKKILYLTALAIFATPVFEAVAEGEEFETCCC